MGRYSMSVALAIGAAMLAGPSAGSGASKTWHDTKCARYRQAWSDALRRVGPEGLSKAFLDRHEAFLASNCTLRADVCPRSPEELKLANTLVILSMNFGTASTFVPFACR